MKVFSRCLSLAMLMVLATVVSVQSAENHGPPDKLNISESYGSLPLYFIENDGQVDEKVRYYEKGAGHAIYFTKDGVRLSLASNGPSSKDNPRRPHLEKGGTPAQSGKDGVVSEAITLSFVSANENPEIIAEGLQPGKVNFLIGNDRSKWRTNISTYSSVLYKEVYEGIDIRFYGNNEVLEYDIIVKPGADPSVVRFAYEGIEGLRVADNGDLEVSLKLGKVVQRKPYIYQEIDGERKEVSGSFVVSPVPNSQSPVPNSYSFAVASYDAARELVIDPVLAYSSYLGGADWDEGRGVAIDPSGNAYVVGFTDSTDFPTLGPIYGNQLITDVFVTKINPAGSALVYSTYIGGGSWDYGYGIAVNGATGDAYVTGYTYSGDFPVTGTAYQATIAGGTDVFLAVINPAGSAFSYSTYLGGAAYDYGYGIARLSTGNVFMAGYTDSTDFPVTEGALQSANAGLFDAFISVMYIDIGPPLSVFFNYSSYMGGTSNDYGQGIAANGDYAHVVGYTESTDFPTTGGALQPANAGLFDAFVARIHIVDILFAYSTYMGGTGNDYGQGIAADVVGYAYVVGYTDSTDFPVSDPYQMANAGMFDAFASRIVPNGSGFTYSTYLGGADDDYAYAVTKDASDNAYLTGYAYSTDFPVTSAYQTANAGLSDVFVSKFDAFGANLTYSTFLGGTGWDEGYGIAVDGDTYAYVAGYTDSTAFPTASFDTTYNGNGDAFVAKVSTNAVPALSYSAEAGYGTDGLNPETGTGSTVFVYKVVYTDLDNDPPASILVHIDGNPAGVDMSVDLGAAPALQDGNYVNGEQYSYSTTLAPGAHDYYFSATDGIDSVLLPASGTLSGPTVSDLEITTSSPLPNGMVGTAYSQTLSAIGGTTPYAWSVTGALPPGLSINALTGEVSGMPIPPVGLYGFTAEVTDAGAFLYSKAMSITIDNENTPPTGSIIINAGDAFTSVATVTLTLACDDPLSGCAQMRFNNEGGAWSALEPFATTKSWDLSAGDGVKTVYVEFVDGVGNASTYSDDIGYDTTAPTGTIVIDSGAPTTTSTSVMLTLTCDDGVGSGCDSIRFSNDGVTWDTWEPYVTTKAWTLTAGDGTKTVYVQFIDAMANISGSFTDDIIYDTTAPTGSIVIDGGATYATSTSVTLTLACDDGAGGSGCDQMRFSNDDVTWSGWEPFATSSPWTLTPGDGLKTVYVQLMDVAGNMSPNALAFNDSITLDSTLPTGSIVIDGDAPATASTAVTLTLACDDAGGSGCDQMQFSNDGVTWDPWEPFATSRPWLLTAGDGVKTVYAQFRDLAGNVSSYSDSIIYDTTAPTGTIVIDGGAPTTTSTSVTLTLTCDDAGGSGCDIMRFSNDGVTWSVWEFYGTTKAWTLTAGDGPKTVYAEFEDWLGNVSSTYTDTIIYDTTTPTGSVIIDGGAPATASTSVTLTLACDDGAGGSGCDQMQFSNDGVTWSGWEPYGTTKALVLTGGDGVKTVYAEFMDLAGNVSDIYMDDIIYDTAVPTGSMIIDGGASATNSTSVTLTLACDDAGGSGCDEMRFSNDGVVWDPWEPYGTTKAWTLTAGDGTKTVYAQFQDLAGNSSATYTDDILLDSTVPTGSIIVNSDAVYTTTTSVTLTLTCADANSGCADMRFSNDGVTWSSWGTYATSKLWTLTLGDGPKTVYAEFRDAAGNSSATYTDDITLDSTAPTGTLVINSGAADTTSPNVALAITCADDISGCDQMRFSNSNDDASWSAWEAYGTNRVWTLSTGDGVKTVYVQFRDVAGNASGSFTDDIILDSVAPTGTVLIDNGETYTTTTAVNLTLTCIGTVSDCAQMRFSNDDVTWSSWETYAASRAWTLSTGDGTKTVYAQFKDIAGNASLSYTDDIILDSTAPTGTIVIDSGATYTTTTAVTLTLTCSDDISGCADMRFSNDDVTWSVWEAFATSWAWTLTAGDGPKTVYVQFRDALGNMSPNASAYNDTITLDSTAPTGSVLIDSGAGTTTTTAVTLTLACSDAIAGCADMRFGNDGVTWSSWEAYGTTKAWTLISGDGTRTVYAEFRDALGNVSTTYTDTIIHDTTAPTGTVVIDSGVTYTTTTGVTLTLTCVDAVSGCADMRFSNDGVTWDPWGAFDTNWAWELTSGDGPKTVYAQFRDVAGNASDSYTDGIILDSTVPTGSIVIDAGAAYTTTTSVTLTLACTDATSGCDVMRFSNDDATWSDWEAYGTTKAWTLTAGDGAKTVYAQFRDVAGNSSSTYSDGITYDATAPTGSVSVNSGATYTNSTDVTLALSCVDAGSGCAQMRFSNDDVVWSSWETYATSKAWTLLYSGDGASTVYAEFRDAAGNGSTTYSDDIIIDLTAPTGTVVIDSGATYATTTAVTLTLTCVDATSGCAQMQFSNDNATWSSWEAYAASKAWTLTTGDGAKTVYAQFRDTAGNSSSTYSDGITLDSTAPTGSVSVNDGATYTTTTAVTLTLTCADTYSGCDVMRFSNDNATWSSWETYAPSRPGWTLASGDGAKTVYAQFRDVVGNASGSYTDGIILDTVAPTGSNIINSGATYTTTTAVTLTLGCTDATSGCAQMRFSNDGVTWSSWEAFATSKAWTLLSGDGMKTAYAQFKDAAGNASELFYGDDINLDSTAPTGSIVVNSGATYTTTTAVTLALTCADANSGCDVMRFMNAGGTWSSWEAFAASKAWTLASGDGAKTVYAQFRDVAGNVSSTYSDGIILDTTAPTGTIVIDSGATYTTLPAVTLTLTCSDATSGCAQMRFSNDNAAWSEWEAYATSKSWALTEGDGAKTAYVQFRDTAGNASGSYTDGISVDSISPTGSVVINSGAGTTNSTAVTLTVACSDAISGCADMRFSNDDVTWSAWEPYAASKAWTLTSGEGKKIVSVRFRDILGNASGSYSDSIMYVQTRFEETDPAVTYTGTWTSYACGACSAGAIKYSKQAGAKASFTFTGKGVKWYASKAKMLGKAKVYIDGVLQTTVDLYSATNQVQQMVYQKTWPVSGVHTIRVDFTGTKNVNATDTNIDIDAFEITP